jgi:hypothetical protein
MSIAARLQQEHLELEYMYRVWETGGVIGCHRCKILRPKVIKQSRCDGSKKKTSQCNSVRCSRQELEGSFILASVLVCDCREVSLSVVVPSGISAKSHFAQDSLQELAGSFTLCSVPVRN